jgi:hypothetical protein
MIFTLVIAIFGMLKEILYSIAIGVFAILITLTDKKMNHKIALGIMVLVYGIPTILWFFIGSEIKDKNQVVDYGPIDVAMLILVPAVQIIVGYLVGKLIVEKKVLKTK